MLAENGTLGYDVLNDTMQMPQEEEWRLRVQEVKEPWSYY